MSKEQAEIQIKAAAYAVAATLGVNEAVKLLEAAARELTDSQWRGPGNR